MSKQSKNNLRSYAVGLAVAIGALQATSAQAVPPCTGTSTATNLAVCSASLLGGSSNDTAAAVEIAPDQTVVLGGTIIGNNFGKTPVNLMAGSSTIAGGNGAVIRTDMTGKSILSVTRLGNVIDDLDVNRTNGKIAVAGDFGIALLSANGSSVLWSKSLGVGGGAKASNGRRIAVSQSGQVAALFNKKVTVFDEYGRQLGTFTPAGTYVEDIAIDSFNNSVIVTGFSQKDGGGCPVLQVAYVRAYSYTGALKWTQYDWTKEQVFARSSCADTRGTRIALGRDNVLYFAGESAGGTNIYRYDARNISLNAPNVGFDKYNQTFSTGALYVIYYSRISPSTGNQLLGQYAVARTATSNNTIVPRAITADEKGNVYVGGVSTYAMANRDPIALSIAGRLIGPYSGGDGFVLVASPDFKTRKTWATWTGLNTSTNPTTVVGVAAAKGSAAVISTSRGNMMTVNPLQGLNRGGTDAFFSVFPALP